MCSLYIYISSSKILYNLLLSDNLRISILNVCNFISLQVYYWGYRSCISLQELKGNTRVFCRVWPMLPDDDESCSDLPVAEYPNSMELQGNAIELIQPQQAVFLAFDSFFAVLSYYL